MVKGEEEAKAKAEEKRQRERGTSRGKKKERMSIDYVVLSSMLTKSHARPCMVGSLFSMLFLPAHRPPLHSCPCPRPQPRRTGVRGIKRAAQINKAETSS